MSQLAYVIIISLWLITAEANYLELVLIMIVQVYEVLDNCIDEVQGGYAKNVKVSLHAELLQTRSR